MKVLFVSETFDPDSGGIGTSARRIAHSIAKRGVDIQVLAFRPAGDFDDTCHLLFDVQHGISCYYIAPHFVNSSKTCSPKKKATLRRNAFYMASLAAEEVHPDVIHSFSLTEAGYLGTLLARRFSVPHT